MLKNSQIKRENKRIIKLREQSRRKQNCKSCKYIRLSELTMGYECYVCKLYDPDFSNSNIYNYKCKNYSPDREYKKYLERVKHEKERIQ